MKKLQENAVDNALSEHTLKHICIDISSNEVAKYIVSTPDTIKSYRNTSFRNR